MTVLEVAFDLRFEQIGDCLPAGWLRARVDPFQKEEAAHVVDDIGHLPLRLRELQRLARMTILVRQLCPMRQSGTSFRLYPHERSGLGL
ncbi:hypothetical protein WH240_12290 [Gluconobacter wancherniae]|uniref:hypothetical protein n=1 Tax=Gluconobacter wancherniae TaxID=1307955 RepID=UPI003099DE69